VPKGRGSNESSLGRDILTTRRLLPNHRLNIVMPSRITICAILLVSAGSAAFCQKKNQEQPPKNAPKATLVRNASLYIQPDESADRVAVVTPGREMVIAERSGHWLRVFANIDAPESRQADQPVLEQGQEVIPISGWMLDKGIVDTTTPHGDAILFGEAISAEDAASEPHAPAGSALEARLLYRRVFEMFPQSPLAPEAMWRAADVRWQLQKADAAQLPSAHEKENYLREQMDEDEMKKIEKNYPHTRWADFAAYELIDNKLCGDWQGSEKCPEKEADMYLKYVSEHPESPRAPEALYKAAWRMASAGDMWAADNDDHRAQADRSRATDIANQLQSKYPQSEYADRSASLIYKVQQGIPIYGSDRQ